MPPTSDEATNHNDSKIRFDVEKVETWAFKLGPDQFNEFFKSREART